MDHRKYFTSKLSGDGIDIGALHRPMIKHDGMKVKYVDRLTVAELKHHYPELSEFPLVEADVIDDAQTLYKFDTKSLDFVIASHVIEHMSDPISAIARWIEILKPGGFLYLVVPDKRYIFDRHRPLTELQHLIDDRNTSAHRRIARDWHHYLEYAELVDKKEGAEIEAHATKLRDTGYSIHFHTFIPASFHDVLLHIASKIAPLSIKAGPRVAADDKHEFHFLVERI